MTTKNTLVVDEIEMAAMLNVSVHYLRKDRQTLRRIPYFRIGRCIRYSADYVMCELEKLKEGGTLTTSKRGAL